jgi:hypothetical protein
MARLTDFHRKQGSSSCFCALLFSHVARTIGPGGMRTPAFSPVTVHTVPPRPASPRRLATNSGPKIEPYTILHPSTHTYTSVLTDVGNPAALPCTTAVPSLGVDAVVPAMASTSPHRSPPPRSFASSPSNPVGSRKPHHGACCPGATRSHRRRDHPALPLLWAISSNAWRWTLTPRGF